MTKAYRDLFKGTAPYYARYRPPHPQPLIDAIIAHFGLNGTGRLLDLGCGTGQLALPLAAYVADVVAMDPEPEMLVEAREAAHRLGIGNVTWIEAGSEDLTDLRASVGTFRLATIGNAFHWMDRDVTLRALDEMIEPGGGVTLTGGRGGGIVVTTNLTLSPGAAWQQVVRDVVRRWLGEERRAGSGVFAASPERHEAVLARSPFRRFERFELTIPHRWTLDSLIGHLYSTSFCSKAMLGEHQEPFERDLRESLLGLNPAGEYCEEMVWEAFIAWRG